MKNYLFSKILLLGILLAISYNQAVAYKATFEKSGEDPEASGVIFQGANTWNSNVDYLYTFSELVDCNIASFGPAETIPITSIGFKMGRHTISIPGTGAPRPIGGRDGGDVPRNTTIRIYMANVDMNASVLQRNVPCDDGSWTLVFEWDNFSFTKYKTATEGIDTGYGPDEWVALKFNTPQTVDGFQYRTDRGLRIKICMDRTTRVGTRDTLASIDNSVPVTNNSNCFVYNYVASQTMWGGFNDLFPASYNPDYCNTDVAKHYMDDYYCKPQVQFEMELPTEEYTVSEGGTETPYVFHQMSNTHRFQLVPQAEYYGTGQGKAGTIKSLSLRAANIVGSGINETDRTVRIYMAIAPNNVYQLDAFGPNPYSFQDWTLVYEKENFTYAKLRADNGLPTNQNYNNGDWIEFPFNVSDFEYTTGYIMYYFCSTGSTGSMSTPPATNGTMFYAKQATDATGYASFGGPDKADCDAILNMGNAYDRLQLDVRFGVSPLPANYAKYENVVVNHPTLESTVPAAQNVNLLHMNFKIAGDEGEATLQNLTFLNKSLDGYVTTAKLWYTGNVAGLSTATATPIKTVDLSGATDKNIKIEWLDYMPPYEDGPQLGMGQHHFWLTFDIAPGVEFIPNAIDVSLTGFTIADASPNQNPANFENSPGTITTPDPEGAIDVSDFLAVYCPPGVSTPLETAPALMRNGGPWAAWYNIVRSRNVYTHDELNNGTPGIINEMAVFAWNSWRQGGVTHDSVYIFMRNLPQNSGQEALPPDHFQQENDQGGIADMGLTQLMDKYKALGYVQVAGPFELPSVIAATTKTWVNFPFTTKFQYTGGDLEVIVHRVNIDNFNGADGGGYTCSNVQMDSWEEARYSTNGEQFYSYCILQDDGGRLGCDQLINSTLSELTPMHDKTYTDFQRAPKSNARFSFQYIEGSQYRASNAFHTSKPYITNGTQADEVLGVMIETEGMDTDPYEQLSQMIFNGKNSHNVATHAMLYYSELDSTFGVAKQIGEEVALTASNISNIQFDFDVDEVKLKNGKNYFWLAYRIPNNADNIGKEVDAQFVSGELRKYNEKVGDGFVRTYLERTLTSPDPAGVKTIVGPLSKNTYYVGNSSSIATDYATLADFADAYNQYGTDHQIDVIIVSDITDSKAAAFNYNPYRGNAGSEYMQRINLTIDPAATADYTLASTQNGGSVIELLPGYQNFSLWAVNENNGPEKLIIDKQGTGGNAITATKATNIAIWNANIKGNTNGISIDRCGGNVNISQNTITRASNYAVLLNSVSGIIAVEKNNIGSAAAADVRNGLALIGCEGTSVKNNKFTNITSTNTEDNRAILVSNTAATAGTTTIYNNTINDVKSSRDFASAFEFNDNAGSISVIHNTVIFSPDRGSQIYSSIFKLGNMAADATLSLKNNLFINSIGAATGLYTQQYYDPTEITTKLVNFEDVGNVYSGGRFMRYGNTDATYYDFAAWKAQRTTNGVQETALTSNYISTQGSFANVGSADFHTDGPIINDAALLVNLSVGTNFDNIDIDGNVRGQFKQGKTMAGADEFFPIAKNDPNSNTLPASISMCENAYESIILQIDRRFEKWSDGVNTRTYIPQAANYWIKENGDTLKSDNGIDLTRYPYLYIERPNYTHTMKLKCVSTFWLDKYETDWCDIVIMQAPFIRNIPDVAACGWTNSSNYTPVINNSTIEVEAADYINGSAKSFQWQKKTGTTWTNVGGQTTSKLSFAYASREDIEYINGTYRLQVTPYNSCQDNSDDVLYSNEIDLNINANLASQIRHNYTNSNGTTSTTQSFCTNEEVWVTENLTTFPVVHQLADFLKPTRLQWEKRGYPTTVWLPVDTITNPSAATNTLRFSSIRSEDAGVYRCIAYGSGCSNYDIYTPNTVFTLNVISASEILTQPAPVTLSCVGRTLTDEISVGITDPANTRRVYNKYQWLKDGKEFKRLDASGNEITPSHPLYATHRTDTTYLPFAKLTLEDGGNYVLRTIYLDCDLLADTVFSDTARLYSYKPATFRSQSDSMYVTISGYANLEMNMLTDMANNDENLGVTYLWYRQRTIKTPTGNITRIDTLRNSPKFSVMAGQLRINNITVMDVNQLDSITLSDNYYCAVTDYCSGAKITSKPMKLKLAPEITIVKSPDSAIVCEGENVTMAATATSADNTIELIYEWYKVVGGTPVVLPGENNTTLVLSTVNADDATDYYCIVSLKGLTGASKRTDIANITINPKPIISSIDYPAGGVVAENSPFTLTAVIEAATANSYQWYFNGTLIDGATSIDYNVTAATKANEGSYYVVATNDCGETQSTPVEIKITVGIATTNDDPTFHIVSVSPNPIANDATVKFVLPAANTATLTLLDLNGRQVVDLYSGSATEGTNTVLLTNKLSNVSTGTYFILLESQGRKASLKITISKQ